MKDVKISTEDIKKMTGWMLRESEKFENLSGRAKNWAI